MPISRTIEYQEIPGQLLTDITNRDAAVWLLESFVRDAAPKDLADLLSLPWSMVLSESSNPALIDALSRTETVESTLVRQRGLIHLIDVNPAEVTLPPRGLPIFLLNGRNPAAQQSGLAAMTRRLTMLAELQRHSVKQLIVLAGSDPVVPDDLTSLWADGFRSTISVVSNSPEAVAAIERWRDARGAVAASVINIDATTFASQTFEKYYLDHTPGRVLLRIRRPNGNVERIDVSGIDDPEHPILGRYEILSDSTLRGVQPENLSKDEVETFFKDASASWRPFAAGMPWARDDSPWLRVRSVLRRLDRETQSANPILYVQSESGAGATTLVRTLAWTAAEQGYPTLVAGPAPFTPNGVEVATFIGRIGDLAPKGPDDERLYQAPWLLVFDKVHWEGQESEIVQFSKELERSGRRACIIVITGPYISMGLTGDPRFAPLAELSHEVSIDDAVALGAHLNKYLRPHGPVRTEAEWRDFFRASAVQAGQGIASFWIALSFWLQRQFDMGETVQSWVYRQYKTQITDPVLKSAIIDIAALSTERLPFPEQMLPLSTDWPTSDKLSDAQKSVSAIGLVRIRQERDRYWALIHDILGRYILTSLFYDFDARKEAGFEDAKNPEHLRFLALRRISALPALELSSNRKIAESFAISIFKIDPDHGHASFSPYWREALGALDEMPRSLRSTSRAFLHHAAISRRRISKDDVLFPMPADERIALLTRAIADIESALSIAADPDGDTDLSLLNSLAHAYHDLAEEQFANGGTAEELAILQEKARTATRRAYRADPDNSFTVETYARDLLSEARTSPDHAAANAIEVLGIVYTAMGRDKSGSRRYSLARLADSAIDLLLEAVPESIVGKTPETEAEAIAVALYALVEGVSRFEGMELSDYPPENRKRTAELLANSELRGNPQAVKIRYLLTCLDQPLDFPLQLELLQALDGGAVVFSPQMQLEYALLLHQVDRHHEADQRFRRLRQLWRDGTHYVEVPERLRWLLVPGKTERRQVSARVASDGDQRSLARIREFQDATVLFRPQEFGQQRLPPGLTIGGLISFGHNGPFLRPLTAS